MGNTYSDDDVRVVVREREVMVPVETKLEVKDGSLVFGNAPQQGRRVPVLSGRHTVRVGCHSLTREAWELLKWLVDG